MLKAGLKKKIAKANGASLEPLQKGEFDDRLAAIKEKARVARLAKKERAGRQTAEADPAADGVEQGGLPAIPTRRRKGPAFKDELV